MLRRRDRDLACPGDGDGDSAEREKRGTLALDAVVLVVTSEGVLEELVVGPPCPNTEGLTTGFMPETLSSLDLANGVVVGNADPGFVA